MHVSMGIRPGQKKIHHLAGSFAGSFIFSGLDFTTHGRQNKALPLRLRDDLCAVPVRVGTGPFCLLPFRTYNIRFCFRHLSGWTLSQNALALLCCCDPYRIVAGGPRSALDIRCLRGHAHGLRPDQPDQNTLLLNRRCNPQTASICNATGILARQQHRFEKRK